jgi:hypothetical protein
MSFIQICFLRHLGMFVARPFSTSWQRHLHFAFSLENVTTSSMLFSWDPSIAIIILIPIYLLYGSSSAASDMISGLAIETLPPLSRINEEIGFT